jgi:hypothetical protein
LIVVALILFSVGCSGGPGPMNRLSSTLGLNSQERLIRKQAEADSFPSAKQVGL